MDYFLADDLSGALDAAGGFHAAGRRVRIVLSATNWAPRRDDDLIGITTETRNVAADLAAETVTGAIRHAQRFAGRLLYKKIDSTLRGPVAAELEALAAALPHAHLLLAPANPTVGRTVRDGVLCVNGTPVAETEFGADPVWPVRESRVGAYARNVSPGRILIPDTVTPDDLDAAVARARSSGRQWVGVGSGALARPMALVTGERTRVPPAADTRSVAPLQGSPGVLLIGGSAHPANREQARLLATRLGAAVHELRIDLPEAAVEHAVAALAESHLALLLTEASRRDSRRVLDAITRVVDAIVTRTDVRRLFLTGGETAFSFCARREISSLFFLANVEAGLALARGSARDGVEFAFAVKPGGFGTKETWYHAWEALAAVP